MFKPKYKIVFIFDNGNEENVYMTKEQFDNYKKFVTETDNINKYTSHFGCISIFLGKVSCIKFKG